MPREMPFRPYLCGYGYGGAQWSIEVMATSADDAESRLRAIGAWGRVDGERMLRISLPCPTSWWERLIVWLRGADR